MKIYRCTKNDADMGSLLSWHSSKREAEAKLKRHQRERGETACGPECVEAEDIPTDRAGLIGWLNRNFDTNNG